MGPDPHYYCFVQKLQENIRYFGQNISVEKYSLFDRKVLQLYCNPGQRMN